MRGLKEKMVIVTGGASGIGRAIVQRLAEEGAKPVIFDRDGGEAEQTAAMVRDAGGTTHAIAVDITDYEAVKCALAEAEAALGPVHGLVNNAGWDQMVPFVKTGPDLWKKIVDINLYGPVHVTHAVLLRMVEQGGGRIVSISSDAGRVGSTGEAVYSMCKGGVIAFMKTLAREHARQGITCNAVAPGPTETALFHSFDSEGKIRLALERAIPMRRLGQPADYPGIVCFLLSDDATFITGQVLSVSGGLTMNG